jgi:hypothetical protein
MTDLEGWIIPCRNQSPKAGQNVVCFWNDESGSLVGAIVSACGDMSGAEKAGKTGCDLKEKLHAKLILPHSKVIGIFCLSAETINSMRLSVASFNHCVSGAFTIVVFNKFC